MKFLFIRYFLFLSFVLTFLIKAQENIAVQITEVLPFTIEEEKEWFEFSISATSEIDLTDWIISNGKTEKKIKDVVSELLWNENVEKIENNEDKILFKTDKNALFSWKKSPISLADGGGEIKILNAENATMSQITYPKLRKGTNDKKKWAEVWTFDENLNKFFPLIYYPKISSKNHSKLKINAQSPTFPQDIEILISEFAPNRKDDLDFVEIFIKSGPKKINLKYAELKINGTSLWRFEEDFWVKPNDFLVFKVGSENDRKITNATPYLFETSKKSGLSTGSSSVEFNLFTETSLEKNEDFSCFKKENLSKTEKKRVDKFITQNSWQGECIELKNIIKNQSMARDLDKPDNDIFTDFFKHFNGSLGKENKTKNHSPTAIIKIQGSGKTIGNPPFSLNLTGEFSTDPDGNQDLKSFVWKINDEIFSEKENPAIYKIESVGEYKIELTVEDFSGSQGVAFIDVIIQEKPKGGAPSGTQSTKAINAILQDSLNFRKLSTKQDKNTANKLFAEVLQNKNFIDEIIQNSTKIRTPNYNLKPQKLPPPKRILRQRYLANQKQANLNFVRRKIILPITVRQRLKKNIGLIYSWREQPWQALKEELIFYEEDRQKFEYFEAMYF